MAPREVSAAGKIASRADSAELMDDYTVTLLVSSVRNDGPELIRRDERTEGQQAALPLE